MQRRAILLGLAITTLYAATATLAERDAAFIGKRRAYWAYQKPKPPAVPPIKGASNPIDAFLLDALEAKGKTFSAPASKQKLIRRVTLDLTGIPPTPAEVDAFLKDTSPKAYENLVDRLMASPLYGERWGLRWQARLALPRLRHQCLQHREALRPLPAGTTRG
jgi:hypothetical protein